MSEQPNRIPGAPLWYRPGDPLEAVAVEVLERQQIDAPKMMHVYGAMAALRDIGATAVNHIHAATVNAELKALRLLAEQYRDDMHHPPAPDSRRRRLAQIEAVIGPEKNDK